MRPSRHLKSSALLAAATFPLASWRALLILAGGALLDLDRYLWFVWRHKRFALREVVGSFQGRDRIRGEPRLFHSVEFVLILAVAGYFQPLIWFFAVGALFHLALDLCLHKERGRFVFRVERSHVRCLTLELLRWLTKDTAAEDGRKRPEQAR